MDLRLPFASPPSSDPAWSGPSRAPRASRAPACPIRPTQRSRANTRASDPRAGSAAERTSATSSPMRWLVPRTRARPCCATASGRPHRLPRSQPDRDEAVAGADAADAGLPRELPPAETMADIEPEAAPAVAEPEAITPDAESEAEPQPEAEVELGQPLSSPRSLDRSRSSSPSPSPSPRAGTRGRRRPASPTAGRDPSPRPEPERLSSRNPCSEADVGEPRARARTRWPNRPSRVAANRSPNSRRAREPELSRGR